MITAVLYIHTVNTACVIVIVFTSRYKLDELYSGNFNIGKVAMFDH